MVGKSPRGGGRDKSGETGSALEPTVPPDAPSASLEGPSKRRPRIPPPSPVGAADTARTEPRGRLRTPGAAAQGGNTAATEPLPSEPPAPALATRPRRVRTPAPPPVPPRDPSARPPRREAAAPAKAAPVAEPHVIAKPQRSNGKETRERTPRPPVADAAQEQQSAQAAAVLKQATEPLNQLRFLQDFYVKPPAINLGAGSVESSTPPEEITRRMSEVKYQLNVLDALQAVLKEEMKDLERALPSPAASSAPQGS